MVVQRKLVPVEVSALPPEHIDALEDQLLKCLEPVERQTNGRYLAQDMLDLARAGLSFLFIAFRARKDGIEVLGAVVCAINLYPRRKILFIQFLGGDRSRLWRQNMYNLLKRFARDNGCDAMEGIGRVGWLRWFPRIVPIAIMGEVALVGGRGKLGTEQSDGNSD